MSWSVINAAQGYDSGFADTVASNTNTGQTLNVAIGDLLFVSFSFFANDGPTVNSITDTAGNSFTLVDSASGTDGGSGQTYKVNTYRCVATASHASDVVTIVLSSAEIQRGIVVYQARCTNTISLDQHSTTFDNVGGASIGFSGVTTTSAEEIIFMAAHSSWGNSSGFYNVGTGFTFHANGVTDTFGLAVEYKIVSSIQSGISFDMSADVSGTWQAAYATFAEAGAAVRRWLLVH